MKLKRNRAICLGCLDIIESKHRHDFVSCTCGKLSVDGGLDYARRVSESKDGWEDLSVYEQIENSTEEKY